MGGVKFQEQACRTLVQEPGLWLFFCWPGLRVLLSGRLSSRPNLGKSAQKGKKKKRPDMN